MEPGLLVLLFELLIVLILITPVLNSAKQSFVNWLDKQSWAEHGRIVVYVLALLALLNFGYSLRVKTQYDKLLSSGEHSHVHRERALEAERDCYVTGFGLVVLIFMQRYYVLLKNNNQLDVKLYAMKKQAEGASQAMNTYLDSNKKLEKEVAALKKGGATAETEPAADEKEEADPKKLASDLAEAQRQLEALKKQAASQSDLNKQLQTKLDDFEIVMGDSRKKKV